MRRDTFDFINRIWSKRSAAVWRLRASCQWWAATWRFCPSEGMTSEQRCRVIEATSLQRFACPLSSLRTEFVHTCRISPFAKRVSTTTFHWPRGRLICDFGGPPLEETRSTSLVSPPNIAEYRRYSTCTWVGSWGVIALLPPPHPRNKTGAAVTTPHSLSLP